MPSSFKDLKSNRKSNFDKLAEQAQQVKGGGNRRDERFWKLEVNKAGNGSAIIRFLPAPPGEDVPFTDYFDHGYKGPGGWYIHKCPTTIGKDCPACEYNSHLWEEIGTEASKKQASDQKRRLHFVSNVYVVKDPSNPDNEGKVFLFRYGKKIFDMLNDAMHPDPDLGDEPVNPFDLWEGANFRLRAHTENNFRSYDKSTFDSVAPISEDDDELEKIWKLEYKLAEFKDPETFESYDKLLKDRNKALKLSGGGSQSSTADDGPEEAPAWSPDEDEPKKQKEKKSKKESEEVPWEDDGDADDDDFSIEDFQSLAD